MKDLFQMLSAGRMREPSTMAGGAAVVGGLNDMLQIVEPEILDAGIQAAATILFNPTPVGIGMALFGLMGMFMGEKGQGASNPS